MVTKILLYLFLTSFILIFLSWVVKKFPKSNKLFLVILFFYRIPYSYIYHEFIRGDWNRYFHRSTHWELRKEHFEFGTGAMYFILKPLTYWKIESFDIFMVFCFMGYMATVLFYLVIHRLTNYDDKVLVWRFNIFPWILLYPSLHMYTGMISKDVMVYLGLSLIAFNISRKIKIFPIILGLAMIFLVRPHMGVVAVGSLACTSLIANEVSRLKKIIISVFIIIGFIIMIPIVLKLFRITEFSFEALQMAIQLNEGYVSEANTYINMSNYPLIFKMFTYLFRPLFFDSPNLILLEYSFENLIFLILSLNLISSRFYPWLKKQPFIVKFSMVYLLFGTLVLCNGLSVFGLFIRQKTMVFLFFIILLFSFINYQNKIRNIKFN